MVRTGTADRSLAPSGGAQPGRKPFPWVEGSIHVLFSLIAVCMVAPLVLVLSVSFSDEMAITLNGYSFLPQQFTTKAYAYIFESPMILLRAYGVTIFVTVVGTLLALLLTAMTGYVISRRGFRYSGIASFFIFFTMLFNGGLVPSYILITQYLNMGDTIWVLIVPTLMSPFNILIMRGFLVKLPHEIVESAKVDGAGEFRIFFTIILPLSTPALATLGLFISFGHWNSWFPAMLYVNNQHLVPIQLLLVRMMENINFLTSNSEFVQSLNIDTSKFPTLSARMAMAVLAAGPMMFIFPFFQRYFIQGLTIGSLKG